MTKHARSMARNITRSTVRALTPAERVGLRSEMEISSAWMRAELVRRHLTEHKAKLVENGEPQILPRQMLDIDM